jgi:hypothetical protein
LTDIWSLGEIPNKSAHTKVLTSLECITSFADVAFLGGKVINAEVVAMAASGVIFVPHGLPRIVIITTDGLFTGFSKEVF